MKKLKLFLLIWPFTLAVFFAAGQSTKPELAVYLEAYQDPAEILSQLKGKVEDTSSVKLILKAARNYYHHMTPHVKESDSIKILAIRAYEMSRHIRYSEGVVESAFILCKLQTKLGHPEVAKRYLTLVNGEGKAKLLLAIAEFYAFKFDSGSPEFEQAYPLIAQAQKTARSVNSFRWLVECQVLLGKFYLRKGDLKNGKDAFMLAINKYEKDKDFASAAALWSRLGNNIPENESNFKLIKSCQENAIKDYLLANDKEQMAYCLRDLATLNGNYQNLDSAERQLLRVVTILKSVHAPVKFTTYDLLSDFYRYTGKYDKALYYQLLARKAPDFDERKALNSSWALASIYESSGKKDLALKYYMDVYHYVEPISARGTFPAVYSIALLQADMGPAQAKSGLVFLNNFIRNHNPVRAVHQQNIAYAYGDLYNTLGEYKKAEIHYIRMTALDKKASAELDKDIDNEHERLPDGGSAFVIGRFYLGRKRFSESRAFLTKALNSPQYTDLQRKRDTYMLLYKADSALNNYKSALYNLQQYKVISDSLTSVTRAKQLEELNVRYETSQKEERIRTLQSKQKLQDAAIRRSGMIRNFIIWGAAMLALVLVNQRRNNRKLSRQQQEINSKNEVLETLVSEKDGFLKEKDWLLKEIHHRVKNNLQIIISLLSTQSEFLENNAALDAILESQNRVHSIALIHQKLYKSDNPASISIQEYVPDLIENLEDAFDTWSRKIVFEKKIQNIDIDLSQAVPLGLILNESITNAIKYAFDHNGGKILVSLTVTDNNRLKLSVADNGKGLPADFDLYHTNSLGMELIKGLSKQLRGKFELSGVNGVRVDVEFDLLKTFQQ